MKDSARILDATAGNKTMWKKNASNKIIWIDVEEELEYKPDFIMDCTKTDFDDGRFHTIFFDPPHEWGRKKYSNIFTIPNRRHPSYAKYKLGGGDTYYGWDKYETKSKLLEFVSEAQNEFHRILSDDGCLWVKWNEWKISVKEVIPLFLNWDLMMRAYGTPPRQESQTKTYWLLFMKKEGEYQDQESFHSSPSKSENMIHEKYMERFETLRQKLYEFIEYSLKIDGHCKSYEGAFTIEYRFPSYFEQEDDPIYNIHLACYLIGPRRGYDWEGATFGDALRQAERDIYHWIDERYEFYEKEFSEFTPRTPKVEK